jgi:adenylate cyclase
MVLRILILFVLWHFSILAMAQSTADSLLQVWQDDAEEDTTRLDAMHRLIWDFYLFSNPDSARMLTEQLYAFAEEKKETKSMADALNMQGISFALTNRYAKALKAFNASSVLFKQANDLKGSAAALVNIGVIYTDKGLNSKAIDYLVRSIAISEQIGDETAIAKANNNIATIYNEAKDYSSALNYFERSNTAFTKAKDQRGIATTLTNLAVVFKNLQRIPEAIQYLDSSITIKKRLNDQAGLAKSYYHLGSVYSEIGNYERALKTLDQSLQIQKNIGDTKNEIIGLNKKGSIYLEMAMYNNALKWCAQGYAKARERGNLNEQKTACECLYSANKAVGNQTEALRYLEAKIAINDSLNSSFTKQRLMEMEFSNRLVEDSLQQIEEDLKVEIAHTAELNQRKRTRNILISVISLVALLSITLFSRLRLVRLKNRQIEQEKERSDGLLLNILPQSIADELKQTGTAKAKQFEDVAILFTDFKGFTQLSEKMEPQELVAELHQCFKAFDEICKNHHIEKIKTIGDAYMAAGGLPIPDKNAALNTVNAALAMRNFLEQRKKYLQEKHRPFFHMRIGIHTGSVVAGIVGKTKFQYDIWGDAVNTAARMESSGEIGKVNISDVVYQKLKTNDGYIFENRGKIMAKGKGEVDMYFVEHKTYA